MKRAALALIRPRPHAGATFPHDWTSRSWTHLLHHRVWIAPHANRHAIDHHHDETARTLAAQLLSSGLTFPLTLAYALQQAAATILDAHAAVRLRNLPNLSLHIAGARAEASLPAAMWGELGHALQASDVLGVGTSVEVELSGASPWGLGQAGNSEAGLEAPLRISRPRRAERFEDSSLGQHLLHGQRRAQPIPDVFVLFNPGLGFENYSWGLAFEALARSQRPLLLTALSEDDARRDAAFVARAWEAHGLPAPFVAPRWQANPFRSLRESNHGGEDAATKQPSTGFGNALVALLVPQRAGGALGELLAGGGSAVR